MHTITIVAAVLLIAGLSVDAAPNYLGPSGNIMTPDDSTVPHADFSIGYHRSVDLEWIGTTTDQDVWHGHYGLTPSIEVGLSVVDVQNGGGNDVVFNGKWRAVRETTTRPSVAVGVLDVAGNAFDDDPTFYFLVSKNLTLVATDTVEGESRPLRGTIGAGTGFYDGVFAGLDWTLTPQLSAMLEYIRGGDLLGKNTLINGGIRYAVGSGLRLDASVIDFGEIAFGVSYSRATGIE